MLGHRRYYWLGLVLALVIGLAWWHQQRPDALGARQRADSTPDSIINNLFVVEMDARGAPKHRLQATQLRHYIATDRIELDQPRLFLYQDAMPAWTIRAIHGQMLDSADAVELSGEVRAVRETTDERARTTLRTEELRIYPEAHYAATDHFVVIDSQTHWTSAHHGLEAWFEDGVRVKLLGKIRTQIAAHAAP